MFPGGGGMDDRKMQQMMKQMGIDMQELDAEEVIIRTPDEELVFTDADVQRMDAQGQQTYTIVGEAESRPRGDGGDTGADTAESDDSGGPVIEESEGGGDTEIPEEDVELVASQAGVSKSEAREALEDADGEPAAAIARLE
ncbi:nascent polypeptide-associated complex protein [Halobacteriales archaeon QH_1_68_42]|nr:MAG: nascent polypeptide-associated complex protein [Halobacteriales archaeon QH_1_68_42]